MVKCDLCGKEFKNKRGLKIHKSKSHKGKREEKEPKEDERTVQVCPDCGSPRLEYASMDTRATGTITGLGAPEVYYCKNCGYEGSIKVEMPISQLSEEKIEKIKKKKRVDKEKKKKPDILKPIFTTVIILFLIAAILTAFVGNRGQTQEPEDTINVQGYPQYTINDSKNLKDSNYTGGSRIAESPGNQTSLKMVSRGTGIEEATGFFLPMFIIFLFIGLFTYMIWSYGHRIEHFK